MSRFLRGVVSVFVFGLAGWSLAAVDERIDWPDFMGRHDLVWEETPLQWSEGGFIGNGQLGLMAYVDMTLNCMVFHLGRADVTDHRLAPDRKSSFGEKGANVFFHYPRLDLGKLTLQPAGNIQSVSMRQDLWNAELRGVIRTDLGEIEFRAVTPRNEMVHVIELSSNETKADGCPGKWMWNFLPGNPDSPRALTYPGKYTYESNPPPVMKTITGLPVVVQPLLAGGDYATAWLEQETGKHSSRFFITTANEIPIAGKSAGVAVQTVQDASDADFISVITEHRRWWHAFYKQSFVSVPDSVLESFYWVQLYKLGAAARVGSPAIDLFGPWFKTSIWPGMWWNLNVQLTYWPLPPSNHMDLAGTLINEIDRNWDGLVTHFSEAHKGQAIGDMAWVLHNYWLHYRYAGEWKPLAEKWLPKARVVLALYKEFIREESDGRLHLAPMGSPEFMGFRPFKNTNYNLGLIRWLVSAIQELHGKTGAGAEILSAWAPVVKNLADYPVDEDGLMIGSDQSFSESHRHFSHLIGFYPLFEMDVENPAVREILNRSIDHWLTIKNADGSQDRCGFTLAVAASMVATLERGDEACRLLRDTIANRGIRDLILPNTFNTHGGRNVTFETPPAMANATLELLLQSWGGKVRVFNGVPSKWQDTVFHNLRARGGFLVSAERKNGRTTWVAVESLAGEPLILHVPDWEDPLFFSGTRDFQITRIGKDYSIDLQKGEIVLLSPASAPVRDAEVHALPRSETDYNPFGVKPGGQLSRRLDWVVPAPQLKRAEECPSANVVPVVERRPLADHDHALALWTFDETSTLPDGKVIMRNAVAGSDHHLTLYDGDAENGWGATLVDSMPGFGKALQLDGENDAAMSFRPFPATDRFVFECRVHIERKYNENVWIADLPDYWALVLEHHGSRLSLFVWDVDGKAHQIRIGINPDAGWQQISAGFMDGVAFLQVKDGDSGKLEIGKPMRSKDMRNLFIGMRRNYSGYFRGLIDDIRLSWPGAGNP